MMTPDVIRTADDPCNNDMLKKFTANYQEEILLRLQISDRDLRIHFST